MSSFIDVTKHLFLPAIIALALYAFLAYVAVPLYRSHRDRYAQYLPLETISSHTTSLRQRITSGISNLILRRSVFSSSHRDVVHGRPSGDGSRRGSASSAEELYLGEEESESMVGFDVGRRERIRQARRYEEMGSERRLSRDLEEGFRDDSESEEGVGDDRRR